MNFKKEIFAAMKLWRDMWNLPDAPQAQIATSMLRDGLSIEDAARIAPEGYRFGASR